MPYSGTLFHFPWLIPGRSITSRGLFRDALSLPVP
ncbi:hypothetical protein ARTHRO9V_20359 [Arthrobacter sp. 9V]|nr:hypothetical protein ARTHRO9V_20359 [Arthrobacter sp. 9V]